MLVLTWMARWAAELITEYGTRHDEKTAYERIRGSACKKPIAMFGEAIWYLPLTSATAQDNKAEKKCMTGYG